VVPDRQSERSPVIFGSDLYLMRRDGRAEANGRPRWHFLALLAREVDRITR
jgi:hypothetical protein